MYTKELFTVSERNFPLMSIVNNVAEIIDLESVLYQRPIPFAFYFTSVQINFKKMAVYQSLTAKSLVVSSAFPQ